MHVMGKDQMGYSPCFLAPLLLSDPYSTVYHCKTRQFHALDQTKTVKAENETVKADLRVFDLKEVEFVPSKGVWI
jgi:hypothetical protein